MSYQLNVSDPDGFCVCHRCDNPGCVNPSHLFLGTDKDNTQDMVTKGRHHHGKNHKCAKLTDREVHDIRNSSLTQQKIAEMFGIDQSQVSNIKTYKQWKHL